MKKEYQKYLPHLLLLGLLVALRVASAYSWRIDSDEPQHLHVIWGWANSFLQYRDVFDNHAPLFHFLLAPIFKLFGERADILVMMRMVLIPLFLLSLWAIYLLGKTLFSKEAGFWAVVLSALYPRFFLTSLEFRADDLWIVPWLFALAFLVKRPVRDARLVLVGVLLGATAAVSMKTSLLLLSLALAAFAALMLEHRKTVWSVLPYFTKTALVIAGLLLVPGGCILFFAVKGALVPMYYGIIQHNIVPGLGHWKHFQKAYKILLGLLPFMAAGIWFVRQSCIHPELRLRRTVIFLTASFYLLGLYGFWPLITRQDFLPIIPLFIVIAAGMTLERLSTAGKWFSIELKASVPVVLALVELGLLVTKDHPWKPMDFPQTRMLSEVLQLTHRGEDVLDLKGETIFRTRPFYYALEGVTRQRIKLGLIKDSIPEDIVRTGTTVAIPDSLFIPKRGREFLNENFIMVGDLRVVGKFLSSNNGNPKGDIEFEVGVSARYQVISERGAAQGWLDGSPCTQPRELMPGRHVFRPAEPVNGRWAVIWAPAVERGFSPFAPSRI